MTDGFFLRYLRVGETVAFQQASFLGEFVEFAALLDQLCRGVKLRHLTLVEDDDTIGIDDSVDAVRNRNDSAALENVAAQGALEQRVSLHIDRGLLDLLADAAYLIGTIALTVASSRTRMLLGVKRARASETSWR